jgi:hypothetical protein
MGLSMISPELLPMSWSRLTMEKVITPFLRGAREDVKSPSEVASRLAPARELAAISRGSLRPPNVVVFSCGSRA